MKHAILILIILLAAALLLSACTKKTESASYQQISQETAKEMMAKEDGHVIVGVRRQDE